jgi:hypothetical protein
MSYTESKITRFGSHRFDYWQVSERETHGINGFEIHYSDDGECITDHVYTKEDANLIASAPLLYETLKHLSLIVGFDMETSDLIRKAVAVAEGRS